MSRVSLGNIICAGEWRLAALAEGGVDAYVAGARVIAAGQKVPVAVLVTGPMSGPDMPEGGVRALDMTGAELALEAVEAMLPGAVYAFVSAVDASRNEA